MTQRLVMFVALCSLWIFISGCNKNDNPTAPTTSRDVIMPLSVGNQWIYIQTDSIWVSGQIILDTVTWQITHDTTIQNEKWYVLEESRLYPLFPVPGDNSVKNRSAIFINRADGLWIGPHGPGLPFSPYLSVKYPASVNDSWQLPRWDYYDPQYSPTVISTNAPVDVPAGQFICSEIEYKDSLNHVLGKSYYAINIGFIKNESGLGMTRRLELLSYTILKMSTQ